MRYHIGDKVVYQETKASRHPEPEARRVTATAGDDYVYEVDEFCVVTDVDTDDGELTTRTPTGEFRRVSVNAPNLRKANWYERLRYRDRFPTPQTT